MDDCAQFRGIAASAAGTDRFSFRGRDADPLAAPERLTVAEAFRLYAGIDLLPTLAEEAPDRDGLTSQDQAAGVPLSADDSWSAILSRVLVERLEPRNV